MNWEHSKRYFYRLASQTLVFAGFIPVVLMQYRSIVQGQKDTQGKIDEVLKAGAGRFGAQAVSPEKAAQIQDLLRPYLRLYFYLEGARVETDYRRYGDRARLTSYQLELGTAVKTEVGLSLEKFMESKAFADDRQKLVGKYEVSEKTVEAKYEELERYYLTNGMIQCGLESLQIVTNDADTFSRKIDELIRIYDFQISKDALSSQRQRLVEKAAAMLAKSLDSIGGSVLVTGDFRVERKPQMDEFTFTHPASQRFGLPRPITFHFAIPKDKLGPAASALLQNAKQINLRVFGDFIRNDTVQSEYRYEINPVAVYRGVPAAP